MKTQIIQKMRFIAPKTKNFHEEFKMKIKVVENFRYEGEEYEKNDTVELPDSVAKSVIEKGYGKELEESPEIGPVEEPSEEKIGETEEKKGPRWKRKVWISEDRNLSISVWPPGGKFDSPSITLEENRRDDSGNWQTNRTYLPTGSSLLAISEYLRFAWRETQKIKTEKRE